MGLITAGKGEYFKNMQSYFKRIGYELDYTIQNSEDFGVVISFVVISGNMLRNKINAISNLKLV
jgi:hypothetical protein